MNNFGFFQIIKIYAETTLLLEGQLYHKDSLTKPNKTLEGLNLQKFDQIV